MVVKRKGAATYQSRDLLAVELIVLLLASMNYCHGRDGRGGKGPDLTDGVNRRVHSDKDSKGLPYVGGTGSSNEYEEFVNPEYVSAVRALNPTTGERVWQYRVQPKSTSGLLSTAGNLVFGGTKRRNFFALDATSGKELWHLNIGGWVHAAPITYLVNGKQYVSIAAGSALFTFGL